MCNYFKFERCRYYVYDAADIMLTHMDSVALVFLVNVNDDVELIRYGDFPFTHAWYKLEKRRLRNPGESLVLFRGKFDVDQLNRLIADTEYAKTFHDELLSESENWQWTEGGIDET